MSETTHVSRTENPTLSLEEKLEMAQSDPHELIRLLVFVGFYYDDYEHAEEICRRHLSHQDEQVRANAVMNFGHLARRFGKLSPDIKPIIEKAMLDKSVSVSGLAWGAAGDVTHFLGWEVAGYKQEPPFEPEEPF